MGRSRNNARRMRKTGCGNTPQDVSVRRKEPGMMSLERPHSRKRIKLHWELRKDTDNCV